MSAPSGTYLGDILFPSLLAAVASGERNPAVALTEGFQDAFLAGAGLALLGALLVAILISSKDSREHSEAAKREAAPEPVTA